MNIKFKLFPFDWWSKNENKGNKRKIKLKVSRVEHYLLNFIYPPSIYEPINQTDGNSERKKILIN